VRARGHGLVVLGAVTALVMIGWLAPARVSGEDEGVDSPTRTSATLAPALVEPSTPPLLAVVDKRHALDAAAAPTDLVQLDARLVVPNFEGLLLRREAASALAQLLDAAREAGHDLRVRSAYRSYDTQVDTYAYWVASLGEVEANRVSARPGHSEHQLGTTVDLTTPQLDWALSDSLAETSAGRWLLVHAATYGFALSYPPRSEALTGYASEPWHYRYIGRSEARLWAKSGLTLGAYLQRLEPLQRLGQGSSTQ